MSSFHKEPDMPVLVELALHFMGGFLATAGLLAGPLITLGVPYPLIIAINATGGLVIAVLVMLQISARKSGKGKTKPRQ